MRFTLSDLAPSAMISTRHVEPARLHSTATLTPISLYTSLPSHTHTPPHITLTSLPSPRVLLRSHPTMLRLDVSTRSVPCSLSSTVVAMLSRSLRARHR